MRRLVEGHGVQLAAALARECELSVFLTELDREQLGKVCTRFALRPEGTTRDDLIRVILAAALGITVEEAKQVEAEAPASAVPPAPAHPAAAEPLESPPASDTERYREAIASLPRGLLHRVDASIDAGQIPQPGEIVRARHRQYVVSEILEGEGQSSTVVKLSCLDDDAQGRELQILWELELGVERIDPARQGLGEVRRFDEPSAFAAYLHALRWSCVTTAPRGG